MEASTWRQSPSTLSSQYVEVEPQPGRICFFLRIILMIMEGHDGIEHESHPAWDCQEHRSLRGQAAITQQTCEPKQIIANVPFTLCCFWSLLQFLHSIVSQDLSTSI